MRQRVIAVLGLLLTSAPAWAADLKAGTDFVSRAAVANIAAIKQSEVALGQSATPAVKAFARRLLDAHRAAQAALVAAGQKAGVMVPTALDATGEEQFRALESEASVDFDKRFVADQVEIHSNVLTLYADYMLLGDDPGLKALATAAIPIAQSQFSEAQALSGP